MMHKTNTSTLYISIGPGMDDILNKFRKNLYIEHGDFKAQANIPALFMHYDVIHRAGGNNNNGVNNAVNTGSISDIIDLTDDEKIILDLPQNINLDQNAHAYLKSWYSPPNNNQLYQRMNSRAAFFLNYNNISNRLTLNLEQLMQNAQGNGPLRVVFIFKLDDVVGGSAFIDLAFFCKKYLTGQNCSKKLIAHIITNVDNDNGQNQIRTERLRRGRAAARELEFFMNKKNIFDYRWQAEVNTVVNAPIFDECYILTNEANGHHLNYYKSAIVEYLTQEFLNEKMFAHHGSRISNTTDYTGRKVFTNSNIDNVIFIDSTELTCRYSSYGIAKVTTNKKIKERLLGFKIASDFLQNLIEPIINLDLNTINAKADQFFYGLKLNKENDNFVAKLMNSADGANIFNDYNSNINIPENIPDNVNGDRPVNLFFQNFDGQLQEYIERGSISCIHNVANAAFLNHYLAIIKSEKNKIIKNDNGTMGPQYAVLFLERLKHCLDEASNRIYNGNTSLEILAADKERLMRNYKNILKSFNQITSSNLTLFTYTTAKKKIDNKYREFASSVKEFYIKRLKYDILVAIQQSINNFYDTVKINMDILIGECNEYIENLSNIKGYFDRSLNILGLNLNDDHSNIIFGEVNEQNAFVINANITVPIIPADQLNKLRLTVREQLLISFINLHYQCDDIGDVFSQLLNESQLRSFVKEINVITYNTAVNQNYINTIEHVNQYADNIRNQIENLSNTMISGRQNAGVINGNEAIIQPTNSYSYALLPNLNLEWNVEKVKHELDSLIEIKELHGFPLYYVNAIGDYINGPLPQISDYTNFQFCSGTIIKLPDLRYAVDINQVNENRQRQKTRILAILLNVIQHQQIQAWPQDRREAYRYRIENNAWTYANYDDIIDTWRINPYAYNNIREQLCVKLQNTNGQVFKDVLLGMLDVYKNDKNNERDFKLWLERNNYHFDNLAFVFRYINEQIIIDIIDNITIDNETGSITNLVTIIN